MFYLGPTVTIVAISHLVAVSGQSMVRKLTSTLLMDSQLVVRTSNTESSASALACANFCANSSLPLAQDDCSVFYIGRESKACHCGHLDATVAPSGTEETVFMRQGML